MQARIQAIRGRCGGALGIRLGTEVLRLGDIVEKPAIGDDINELDIKAISQTVSLMYAASFIALLLMEALGLLIFVFITMYIKCI